MYKDFTTADLKLLKHLKVVFDNTNDAFVAGKYGQYMPVGLLIVHTVTLCSRHGAHRFKEDEMHLYHQMVNAEYIKMTHVMFHLIRNEKLILIDQRSEIPIKNKILKETVQELIKNERDDFLSILARRVSFDGYIQTFKNTRGISPRDPKIIAAMQIQADIMDQRRLLNTELSQNDVLYKTVKDLQTVESSSTNDVVLQQKREDVLIELLTDLDLKVPADMRKSRLDSPELLWAALNEQQSDVFPSNQTKIMGQFFDAQLLCAFSDEDLAKISKLRTTS